jgi:UDP-3-O-[3-hydroxymyristoyl] glucosamine N-acyltransferase
VREAAVARGAALVVADPYASFARLTQWWASLTRAAPRPGIHASAVVDPTATVAQSASIGALVVVEAGARIGEGAVIGASSFIGEGASVGEGTRFAAHVVLHAGCSVGARSVIHSGAVIGADGFGFAPTEGRWEKIEQLGAVRIGDDVEIGANTCVDRGALTDTVIGDGVKLDDLVMIGHNSRIGDHTLIAGCAGLAGSAVVGKHVFIGGASMINGHLTIADHTQITGGSFVGRSIHKAGLYSGVFPIDENANWEKNAATLRQLHSLRDRIRALEALQNNKP